MGEIMSDEHVLTRVEKNDHIVWMTLNRPEKKNCLSNKMMDKMIVDIKAITEDRDIKVLVLSAAGDSFCSGLDLHDLREATKKEHRFGRSESTREITQLLRKMPQITIASVRGWCLGGGIALLNACDLAIGAEDARIGMPEVLRGSYGEVATPTLFHAKIPLKTAFYISLTGRNLTGIEAARVGLLSQAVPADQLDASVKQLATEIASRHRVTLTHAKIAGYTEVDLPFPEAMAADELIGHRQRYYLDPLDDVGSYLKSQKGGGNTAYKKPDA
jgi:enoyl-CoA hydratase/carnithine racemase